jgi:hypothetical protein
MGKPTLRESGTFQGPQERRDDDCRQVGEKMRLHDDHKRGDPP